MRPLRHLTPRYIWDRSTLALRQVRHPDEPWLTAEAVALLSQWLRPSDVGLECGSGRSTAWFARRTAHLVSLEHHPQWFQKVTDHLASTGLAGRVDYRLLDDGLATPGGGRYVQAIRELPASSLDFALIDGVARAECIVASLPRLRPGGILVVDNVNWYWPRDPPSRAPHSRKTSDGFASVDWELAARLVDGWRRVWTTDGVSDTAIWFKPPLGEPAADAGLPVN